MICLRCGYCCKSLFVIIVDDPEKGITENNLKAHDGTSEPCPHLSGKRPGEYFCNVHNKPWYKETPCFKYSQVEAKNSPCRIGEYALIRS